MKERSPPSLCQDGSLEEQHIAALLEVVEQLLAVPELHCYEVCPATDAVIAEARVLRSAILDECAAPQEAP